MISIERFLQKIDEITEEKPSYRRGGTAKDGTCDCIGLIVGALRRAGGKWRGTIGSNYAARFAVRGLTTAKTRGLKVGMLVFKAHASQADLPARYKRGGSCYTGDLNDYYHVGVVRQVKPLRITHCTVPTIKRDTSLKAWSHMGWPTFLKEENV